MISVQINRRLKKRCFAKCVTSSTDGYWGSSQIDDAWLEARETQPMLVKSMNLAGVGHHIQWEGHWPQNSCVCFQNGFPTIPLSSCCVRAQHLVPSNTCLVFLEANVSKQCVYGIVSFRRLQENLHHALPLSYCLVPVSPPVCSTARKPMACRLHRAFLPTVGLSTQLPSSF